MKINLTGPCNHLGYGIATLNLALALRKLNHQVAWWPIGQPTSDPAHHGEVMRMINAQEFFDPNAPSVKIWHQFDMAQHVGRGPRCGMPIFEVTEFNRREKHHLDSLDKILVNSHWAMQVVNMNLPLRVRDTFVSPLGVDRTIFHENVGQPQRLWTTFLNIGKWEKRKGHDLLTIAFNKAFEPRDRVRLWMMNDNPFLKPEDTAKWHDLYKNTKMGNAISFLPRVATTEEVAKVMSEADCGVFPARAEGWNLELLEMMSMGKQVITTNYSAHTEYCTNENSMLINIDKLESAVDGVWFHGTGQWAEFTDDQIDQLVVHLRSVHANKNRGVNVAGIETANRFSWEAAAQRLVRCLELPSTDY